MKPLFGPADPKRDANSCDCDHWPLQSLLVTPSFVRDIRDPNLLGVWNSAFEALRRAGDWIIVGYSMPPEDVAIRAMLFRAYQSRRACGKNTRIQIYLKPGDSPANYQILFPKCKFYDTGMEGFVKTLT